MKGEGEEGGGGRGQLQRCRRLPGYPLGRELERRRRGTGWGRHLFAAAKRLVLSDEVHLRLQILSSQVSNLCDQISKDMVQIY